MPPHIYINFHPHAFIINITHRYMFVHGREQKHSNWMKEEKENVKKKFQYNT